MEGGSTREETRTWPDPQNCINGGRNVTSEVLSADKQQGEGYRELVAEMVFAAHIKVKIVQMKISRDKGIWELPKANPQAAVKNKGSSCEESLKFSVTVPEL